MIAGFAFQVGALRFGPLALVQPILAIELLFVFGYLALLPAARRSGPRVRGRDWLAVAVMCAGISVFLRAAAPSGGRDHAPAGLWWLAAAVTLVVVAIAIALSERAGGSSSRRAALLGIATGITWGFVAAVIKELSSHVAGGPAAIFTNWSAYALMITGAAGMLLASHAFAAGPLAASQPGFTILDPVTATLLGVFLFSEHLATSPAALTAEAIGLLAARRRRLRPEPQRPHHRGIRSPTLHPRSLTRTHAAPEARPGLKRTAVTPHHPQGMSTARRSPSV